MERAREGEREREKIKVFPFVRGFSQVYNENSLSAVRLKMAKSQHDTL